MRDVKIFKKYIERIALGTLPLPCISCSLTKVGCRWKPSSMCALEAYHKSVVRKVCLYE